MFGFDEARERERERGGAEPHDFQCKHNVFAKEKRREGRRKRWLLTRERERERGGGVIRWDFF